MVSVFCPHILPGTTLGNVPNNLLIIAFSHLFSALTLLDFLMPFDTIDPSPCLKNQLSLDLRDRTSAIFSNFTVSFALSSDSDHPLIIGHSPGSLLGFWLSCYTFCGDPISCQGFSYMLMISKSVSPASASFLSSRPVYPMTGHLKFNVSKQISLLILPTSVKVPSA